MQDVYDFIGTFTLLKKALIEVGGYRIGISSGGDCSMIRVFDISLHFPGIRWKDSVGFVDYSAICCC